MADRRCGGLRVVCVRTYARTGAVLRHRPARNGWTPAFGMWYAPSRSMESMVAWGSVGLTAPLRANHLLCHQRD
jgi:hypothetical protein